MFSHALLMYTVKSGNSLSSIAEKYHTTWQSVYAHNREVIGPNPNEIRPGMKLRVRKGDHKTYHISLPEAAPAAVSEAPAAYVPRHAATGVVYAGGFQSCVIRAESGGDPDIWNASGHWGLYQFSASTWEEYGGNPADFGHASVSEQNQVFANALAQGGESNWAPYDHC